jgi:hypothetical protein
MPKVPQAMEFWSIGVLEYWSVGWYFPSFQYSITPSLHHSKVALILADNDFVQHT